MFVLKDVYGGGGILHWEEEELCVRHEGRTTVVGEDVNLEKKLDSIDVKIAV